MPMMKRFTHFLLLFLFFQLLVCDLSAQKRHSEPASMTDSIHEIEDVVVTGHYFQKDIIPAQELSGKELQRLSAVSVADAIRYFAGAQIKDYGGVGGLKTVDIRGMGTKHVGVFYDGIELSNAQNGQIDLGRFSMDNMEAIALYNGQRSNTFQSAKDFTSSSSIYLITRKPQFTPGKNNNLRLSMKTGSFGTANPSGLWEHRFSPRITTSLNVEYLYTSGRYKFTREKKNSAGEGYKKTTIRYNGEVSALRLEGGIYGKVKDGEWTSKLYYYDSSRGYPGAYVRQNDKIVHEERQWDRNFFVQSYFRKRFNAKYSLQLNGKYMYDYLHYLADPTKDESIMYIENTYRQQEVYLSVAQQYSIFDFWNVNLASDVIYNKLRANLVNFAYPSRISSLTALATALNLKKVKIQGSLLYTFVYDWTKAPGASAGKKNVWSPTVVVMYRPFNQIDLNLRAFYKKIFRMPTFNDLYYTQLGYKLLNPEFTTQYNVGLQYTKDFSGKHFRRLEMQVDAYYNEVKDMIVAMPTTSFFRWVMKNLGYVEIRGIDTSASTDFAFGDVKLRVRLTYTYEKAQDFTDPDAFLPSAKATRADPDELENGSWYGNQIPFIPWHSGSAIANLAYKDWDMNYSFIYTGVRYASRANILVNKMAAWYTHDLSLSRVIHLRKSELRLTAEVNNIFNQRYDVVPNYPMPGTNVKIKLNWTL